MDPISRHPRSTVLRKAGSASRISTRPHCALRHVRAFSPVATITEAVWGGLPIWRSGSPAIGEDRRRRTGICRRSSAHADTPTYAVGKWHLTPEDETNMAAPRSTWPLGRGFDRWYGFHGGETHQFVPALFHDNHCVRPPRSIDDGYHLSADLVDRAVEFIGDQRAVDADQPFFLYFCTGACHSPHQAPREWIERYSGHFDGGWDSWRERTFARQLELGLISKDTRLSPRPPWVPAWEDLGEKEQALAGRFMECFAGFLSYTDSQLGRLIAFIDDIGELENTVIVLVSDNGASAEGGREGSINDIRLTNLDPAGTTEMYERIEQIGGPLTHNNYPWGWTMAGNTPFRRWKREVHEGGVADPCIVSWPARLSASAGAVRHQFAHAIDILPTVLKIVGIEAPEEIDGVQQSSSTGSASTTCSDRKALTPRSSTRLSTSRCSGRERSTTGAGRP